MRKYRTIWKWLTPGWLQQGEGELVQYVQGLIIDAFYETCRQTVWLTLPSLAPADALERIGQDRGLPRGLFEPTDSYRLRLAAWRYPKGHRVRGSALGLLEQVAIALRGTVHCSIDARGTRFDAGAGATRGVTWDWDGEGLTPNWGRYWLVVQSTGERWPSFTDGAWGETVGAAEDVCLAGSGIHPGELAAVQSLCSNRRLGWTPAGRRAIYLTLYFPGDDFPEPDGTWDVWENRDEDYRYVPLHDSVT